MACTICVAKTKALISCAVTAQLICTFDFEYAKVRFFHDTAQVVLDMQLNFSLTFIPQKTFSLLILEFPLLPVQISSGVTGG